MGGILQAVIGFGLVRGVTALGFGVITFAAVQAGVRLLLEAARGAYNGLPEATLNLAAIGGAPEALGILCGAVMARVALEYAAKFGILK